MTPCISQATTMPASFAEDVENYHAAGCGAIEVWLTKLEQHLEAASVADTRKSLADRGLALPAAAYQGGLLLSQGQERKAHFEHFKRRLDLCASFGISTLILAPDFARTVDAQAIGRAVASLAQAATRSGSTRQSSSSGLWRLTPQRVGSMLRKRLRASRFQLHQRFFARVARPSMRAGRYGMWPVCGVIGR